MICCKTQFHVNESKANVRIESGMMDLLKALRYPVIIFVPLTIRYLSLSQDISHYYHYRNSASRSEGFPKASDVRVTLRKGFIIWWKVLLFNFLRIIII